MTPGFSAIPVILYIEGEEEKLVARIVELVKHKKAERKGDKNEPRPYRTKGRTFRAEFAFI